MSAKGGLLTEKFLWVDEAEGRELLGKPKPRAPGFDGISPCQS